jgi:S-adenosylmethionine hydrolase
MADNRIVTLLTDFGLRDHFVAAMKGVMLSLNPELAFVDISHLVPPQDVFTGAFTLGQTWALFPPKTIHLVVVDPGVGTGRKGIVATAGDHYFVAPDNGILTWTMDEPDFAAYEITADHYFRKPISNTFHGRDVFAPVAGWISRGMPLQHLGPHLTDPIRLKVPVVKTVREGLLQGTILAVDQFGNLITNLKPEDFPESCKIILSGQREITSFRRTYSEGAPGELFMITGSAGYVEISVKNSSAASMLDLKPGALIGVVSV